MCQMLSFVIPCYKSEKTIRDVVNEINSTVENSEYDYEIILVNDSSPDNLIDTLTEITEENNKVTVINLAKNFGQHCALMAGFNHVNGDLIIALDDDGQTPANEVFNLINKIDNNIDVVFAKYEEKKHSFFRNLGSKVNNLMAKVLINKPAHLYLSSYFVAKRFVIDEIVKYKNSYPYISGLLLRTTNKIENQVVNHRQREVGKSNYKITKLISLWMNGFTAFSVKPLRIASVIGFLCAILGFVYGIVIVLNKIFNNVSVLGYSSLMAAILFIGGMIMLILGLIGEYIGRIYISINNSPQYCIKNVINSKSTTK